MKGNGLTANELKELGVIMDEAGYMAHKMGPFRSVNGGYADVRFVSMDENRLNFIMEEWRADAWDDGYETESHFYERSLDTALIFDKEASIEDKTAYFNGWTMIGREKSVTTEEVDENGVEFTKVVTENWKAPTTDPISAGTEPKKSQESLPLQKPLGGQNDDTLFADE